MIVEKNFLSKIKEFGLNTYESKLWAALLSRGVSTAGELSDIADVPRSRSYDVLESLEKKGFVIMKLGKPIKYIAVSPNEVIERVKKDIKKEANQKEKQLEELNKSKVMEELTELYDQGINMIDPTELAGSIKGRENVYEHMKMLIKKAEKEIHIMSSEKGLKRKTKNLSRFLKKAKKKGVRINISGPVSDKNQKIIDKLESIGNLNIKNKNEGRFLIVDNKEMLFMVTDDSAVHPSYDIGIWINSPYFVNTLVRAFDIK
ncbi:hypothetical protein GF327_09785 [Candidatus Woesearchaeota archaeon]|nr:hypothetical protein [Candidatus Woesearchaeota archaeon]